MRAHLNIQDEPDGTISVNAVYELGFNKDSFAHAAVFRALQFLEGQLVQMVEPKVKTVEVTPPADNEDREDTPSEAVPHGTIHQSPMKSKTNDDVMTRKYASVQWMKLYRRLDSVMSAIGRTLRKRRRGHEGNETKV